MEWHEVRVPQHLPGVERMAIASHAWTPLLCVSLTLFGCSKPAPAPETKPAPAPTPVAVVPATPAEEAKEIFDKRCVVCHGEHGMGDGPGAAALQPKPRQFSDQAWQAKVTDEQIVKTIIQGGASVGLSPGMAANPDLASKPDVALELAKIVRKWRK
jgi:mono/diheme cytochrome c family protein